ncbi:hypothetical protein BSZ35_13235 [Salinibacter sp. 10B]|uniref:hypothetical protein n=1 Tax=Salinibacter sp. 10B TaxID=1923971 RepID=UPI000CF578C9|nr:hypothetical protein [Salinibacter sp. 10B]PQJ35439.1 hypothetical protein BSZ35_13235 [Salinibacter sp. 10B]
MFSSRRYVSALVGLLVLLSSGSVQAQSSPHVKTVSDTVEFASTGVLEVENQKGRISVTTWGQDAVGYEVRIDDYTSTIRNTESCCRLQGGGTATQKPLVSSAPARSGPRSVVGLWRYEFNRRGDNRGTGFSFPERSMSSV